ncbi:MAG: hypothetical protein OEM64_12590 [Gammaproteobacteria bacterium]|nr:hypothetical protein [Gammaproteobacteria bacterium]
MKARITFVLLVLATCSHEVLGEVVDSGPNGFSLVNELTVNASRAEVWQAAVDHVGQWWSDDHTI